MRICSLSFFLSWTCWDRKFSHTLCKSKAHCHWPASTYAVFCWSAKICLWILFLSGLWIRLMSKSDLNKNPLKMLFWFLVGKQFQIRKAFNYSIMLGLSCLLFFFILSFHFSPPRIFQENNFCCAYKFWDFDNWAKGFSFLTNFSVFPLRFLWLRFWSSEYCYCLACYFLPKFHMFLSCSELHTTSAYSWLSHLECSYLTLCCCWVCDNFMPLVQLIKLTKPCVQ